MAICALWQWRKYHIYNQHIMLLTKTKLESFRNNHCIMSDYHGVCFWEPHSLLWELLCQHMKEKTKWKPRKISFSLFPPPPFLFLLGVFLFVWIKLTGSSTWLLFRIACQPEKLLRRLPWNSSPLAAEHLLADWETVKFRAKASQTQRIACGKRRCWSWMKL